MAKPLHLYMPDGGEMGCIQAWYSGESSWVEFRGLPYSQWGDEDGGMFQTIHDMMEGWHTTVLHQDSILTLLDKHRDYDLVRGWVDGHLYFGVKA